MSVIPVIPMAGDSTYSSTHLQAELENVQKHIYKGSKVSQKKKILGHKVLTNCFQLHVEGLSEQGGHMQSGKDEEMRRHELEEQ